MKLNITIIGLNNKEKNVANCRCTAEKDHYSKIRHHHLLHLFNIYILNAYEWFTFELSNPFAYNIL